MPDYFCFNEDETKANRQDGRVRCINHFIKGRKMHLLICFAAVVNKPKPEIRANSMPGVLAPGNVHVAQPWNSAAPGSRGQPLGVTTYSTSGVTICDTGRGNLQTPLMMIQNPAELRDVQSQPVVLQNPAGVAHWQPPHGVIQYPLGTADLQTLPGDPQNPQQFIPVQMQTSNQPQWNMSFGSFSTFDPKKFINEEVRTLGVSVIFF